MKSLYSENDNSYVWHLTVCVAVKEGPTIKWTMIHIILILISYFDLNMLPLRSQRAHYD